MCKIVKLKITQFLVIVIEFVYTNHPGVAGGSPLEGVVKAV